MFSANAHLFNFAYILSRSKLATLTRRLLDWWCYKERKAKVCRKKKGRVLVFCTLASGWFAFLSHTVGPIILGRCLSLKRVTSRWDIFLDPASA